MLSKKTPLKRRSFILVMRVFMFISVALTASLAVFMIVYVAAKGLPHISWKFLSTGVSYF